MKGASVSPTVSVLMAVHNGEEYLAEAIDSVLSQEGPDFEFIVVDDGSTDDTASLLRERADPRLVALRNETNLGLTVSLGRGLEVARGAFVSRMDGDDRSLPGRLGAQVAMLEKTQADICFGACIVRDESTGGERERREPDWSQVRWRVLFENAFGAHPSVMFRRESILAVGGYDVSFPLAQDYDLWDRCLARGQRFTYVSKPVLFYRSHDDSITLRRGLEQEEACRRVSMRALTRAFPEAPLKELEGLRWLMTGRPPIPEQTFVEAAVERCCFHAAGFASQSTWKDVAARLARRLKDLSGAARSMAARRMTEAALRSLSPGSVLRALYSIQFPERT